MLERFRRLMWSSERKSDSSALKASALIDLGNTLEDEGLIDQAMAHYEAAIRLAPSLARAHLNRGNILLEKGDSDGALAACKTALVHNPEYAAAYFNMGNAYLHLGRREVALDAYNKAIELQPDFVDAEVARGNIFDELGRFEEAIASYRRGLEFMPDYAEVSISLGNALQKSGQIDEAITSYRKALDTLPDSAEGHFQLANALRGVGQLREAASSYYRALEVLPDFAEACNNLGTTLQGLGRHDDALSEFRRALEIEPDFAPAHNNLGNALMEFGLLDNAVVSIRRAVELESGYPAVHSALLFISNYLVEQSSSLMLDEARRYNQLVIRKAQPYSTWANHPDTTRCLRIGFVSGDLRQHPVGNFLEAVLATLSVRGSGRLELFAYSNSSQEDEVSERIKAHCHGWHSAVGQSDESLAQRIREDGIDILIDLSGHTAHNRLPIFAWKPAPVQASWLGYLATTGVSAIDYIIADVWTLPESEEPYFTEKVWRLPESYLCFTPPADSVDVGPLPAIHNGYITFGSFNNLTKMNDTVVALWSQILAAIPDSRLYLKAKQLKEASVRQSVVERFAGHGIDAGRLILEGPVPRADYLKPFQRVDIALDPFPYPGITTSVENLWMGVPVLTLAGKSFLSRQGVGLLMNAGLPEWIAGNADDYVARALSHGSDVQALASLRAGLRQQVLASPIFDAPRFAQCFEAALRDMWQIWCEQKKC